VPRRCTRGSSRRSSPKAKGHQRLIGDGRTNRPAAAESRQRSLDESPHATPSQIEPACIARSVPDRIALYVAQGRSSAQPPPLLGVYLRDIFLPLVKFPALPHALRLAPTNCPFFFFRVAHPEFCGIGLNCVMTHVPKNPLARFATSVYSRERQTRGIGCRRGLKRCTEVHFFWPLAARSRHEAH